MQRIRRDEGLKLPWDLTEWFPKSVLWAWIVEDIETLDWNNPALVEHLRGQPGLRPKLLLCMTIYGLATEVWESVEIARLYDLEPMIRTLDPMGRPHPSAVAHFRRENRGLLKWALASLLKRVVKSHFELDNMLFPPGLKRFVGDAAAARIDIARHVERGTQGA
jgi:hypothetical protein